MCRYKITIIKSLILPRLILYLSVVPIEIPKPYINKSKRLIFMFLWNSKPEKVKRSTLCLNVNDAGLNMVDIDTYILSLQMNWIMKLFNPEYVASWQTLE